MLARVLIGALALHTAHAAPTVDGELLTHDLSFMKLVDLVAPKMTTSQLDRFLHQFAVGTPEAPLEKPSRSRQLQSAAPIDVPPHTDTVAEQAYNGWIHTQLWRNFTSTVGRPGARGSTTGNDKVVLNYVTARGTGTRGGVIVSIGHTEPVDKYAEQIYDLIDEGFSPVYVLDHRGQGRSSRLLPNEPFKSHVEEFNDFIVDFRKFVTIADAEMTQRGESIGKRFLHCHSMGCAVAFTHLIQEYYAQRPTLFNAVAANAPLIKPVTDPFTYEIAVAIGYGMLLLGLDTSYPPTKGAAFDELYFLSNDRPDRQNIQYARCIARRDTLYDAGHAGLCLGDVTARFAYEFFGAFDSFSSFTKGKLSTPILLQQARNACTDSSCEANDGIVINTEQEKFCSGSADSCTLTRYADSAHNIWFETDTIRDAALREVYDFYETHAGSVAPQNALPPMCKWWEFWCSFEGCSCVWSCSHPAASC